MGEYADYMLNGDDCQYCGEHIGDGDGFPRSCYSCRRDEEKETRKHEDLAKRVSSDVSKLVIVEIEKAMKAKFEPGVGEHFKKNVHGLIRGMYVSEHGVITHDGMRATLQNNLQAQIRAAKRKAKQVAKAKGA